MFGWKCPHQVQSTERLARPLASAWEHGLRTINPLPTVGPAERGGQKTKGGADAINSTRLAYINAVQAPEMPEGGEDKPEGDVGGSVGVLPLRGLPGPRGDCDASPRLRVEVRSGRSAITAASRILPE